MRVQYPNKIYVSEYKRARDNGDNSHWVVVIAAANIELAKQYTNLKLGIKAEPVWLMGAVYPTIWTSNGQLPHEIQATILYNGTFHAYKIKGTYKFI